MLLSPVDEMGGADLRCCLGRALFLRGGPEMRAVDRESFVGARHGRAQAGAAIGIGL
jgi:hypothetical protein